MWFVCVYVCGGWVGGGTGGGGGGGGQSIDQMSTFFIVYSFSSCHF